MKSPSRCAERAARLGRLRGRFLLACLMLGAWATPGALQGQSACPTFSNKPSDTNGSFSFGSFTFAQATVSNFNTGYATLNVTVTYSGVSDSGNHSMCIKTASTTLGADATGSKPLSDLQWSSDSGTTWYPITSSFVEIPGAQWSGSSKSITLTLKVLLDWANDIPNTYLADLQFRQGKL